MKDIVLRICPVRIYGSSTGLTPIQGLCQWKIPMTPSGIEPATFLLVAQCLGQLCHRVTPALQEQWVNSDTALVTSTWSRKSVLGLMTEWATPWTVRYSSTGRDKRVLFSSSGPDWLLCPPSFRGYKRPGLISSSICKRKVRLCGPYDSRKTQCLFLWNASTCPSF